MSSLSIYAGPKALARLSSDGIHRDQFDTLVGASGGPKWFVLHGLDQYLFGEFFSNPTTELTTIGSSAGAWRMCCLATGNPVAAVDRLAERYSEERYSEQPTMKEITDKARDMVKYVVGESGVGEIANNKWFKTYVVADRCRGLRSTAPKPMQTLMLGGAAVANIFNRKTLSWFLERTVFTNNPQRLPAPWDDIKTSTVALTKDNVIDVMMATGAIPFVLDAVRDIVGAKPGLYWDGGITDYHFDLPFNDSDKLVLYPHFSSTVIPGWFDKKVPWRKVHESHFDNVVLVTPSREFTAGLPHGKIPDRDDFMKFPYNERMEYWRTVIQRSQQLGEDFKNLVETGAGLDQIRQFSTRDR